METSEPSWRQPESWRLAADLDAVATGYGWHAVTRATAPDEVTVTYFSEAGYARWQREAAARRAALQVGDDT